MSNNNSSVTVFKAFLLLAFCAVIVGGEKLLFKPFSSNKELEHEDNASKLCPDKITTCPETANCCKFANKYYCCPKLLDNTDAPNIVCPGEKSQCPEGQTCCELLNGSYGCCPLPKAVCCEDKLHCCPTGTVCQIEEGLCLHANGLQSNWHAKEPAIELTGITVCPDHFSFCGDGQTCCLSPIGLYYCCPLPQAVCCSDGVHCCPTGTRCNTATATCYSDDGTSDPWTAMVESKKIQKDAPNDYCPDGHSYCDNGQTCCMLSTGKWGCCPLPNAVCCPDQLHCCPSGSTCDTTTNTCLHKNGLQSNWHATVTSKQIKEITSHDCPDGKSSCLDGQTCCRMSSGEYGCCPFTDAVCCPDGEHCCPEGTTCDATSTTCLNSDGVSESWMAVTKSKVKPKKAEIELATHFCPDGKSYCQDGQTCCLTSTGKFACCPFSQAVCCPDLLSCCPYGSICDMTSKTCKHRDGSTVSDWLLKVPANEILELTNHYCPDGKSYCKDSETCCVMSTGRFGCCPMPQAVCCPDRLHCCPYGSKCNTVTKTCSHQNGLITDWVLKVPAKQNPSLALHDKLCPDLKSVCLDGQTCCIFPSGNYGCCPLPQAVCCPDMEHCCPNGSVCNTEKTTCDKPGSTSVGWFEKLPTRGIVRNSKEVVCPDETSQCPDDQTCCIMESGDYGCCPLPNAVCCNDELHCCPEGYVCDPSSAVCQKGSLTVPWLEKLPSTPKPAARGEGTVVCPDQASYCLDGQTCCIMSTGQYGCCPYEDAVCCSDKLHCCPEGYKCDDATATCTKNSMSVPWLEKLPSTPAPPRNGQEVQQTCQDGSSCSRFQTCCPISGGGYGCCPFQNADCCSDKIHCCANGFKCDASGSCRPGSVNVPWQEKLQSALATINVKKNVLCPNKTRFCEEGYPCCTLYDGQESCCMYKNGVCCEDHIHCCGEGEVCDVAHHRCLGKVKEETVPMVKREGVVVCNKLYYCATDETCCPQEDGMYKCCPSKHASCCKDGMHCCKYWCIPLLNKCFIKKDLKKVNPFKRLSEVEGHEPLKTKQAQKINWCDESELLACPDGYRCDLSRKLCTKDQVRTVEIKARSLPSFCPIGSNQQKIKLCKDKEMCCSYGKNSELTHCCPFSDGVCCDDGLHCCPANSICDQKTNMCKSIGAEFWIGMTSFTRLPPRVVDLSKGERISSPLESSSLPGKDVSCGDNTTCADDTTCCLQKDGQYTCCQFKNAVCCKDKLHCCPQGYQCDLEGRTCTFASSDSSEVDVPMVSLKARAPVPPARGSEVRCSRPDNGVVTHLCPVDHACCFGDDNIPVCCQNDTSTCCNGFCCPSGYACGKEKSECLKDASPMLTHLP